MDNAADVLSDIVTVTVDGDDYMFQVPSIYDEMKIGVRMREIRRRIDPTSNGDDNLDVGTMYIMRACATFETMLKKASVQWPFTAGSAGPVVDSEKFPRDKSDAVLKIYTAFQEKLFSFRSGGVPDKQPLTSEVVAGQ
ncbi:MAG: hypothetical protein KGJ90_00490 [Patescibacteria group bacterium]|nr:hypothetical protein [Patescibacteria group bacterium]